MQRPWAVNACFFVGVTGALALVALALLFVLAVMGHVETAVTVTAIVGVIGTVVGFVSATTKDVVSPEPNVRSDVEIVLDALVPLLTPASAQDRKDE